MDMQKTERTQPIEEIIRDWTMIDAALKEASRRALAMHKRNGTPIVIFADGKPVWIQADQFEVPEPDPRFAHIPDSPIY